MMDDYDSEEDESFKDSESPEQSGSEDEEDDEEGSDNAEMEDEDLAQEVKDLTGGKKKKQANKQASEKESS